MKDSRELKQDILKEFKFINASKMKKGLQLATLLFEDSYNEGKFLLKCDIKNAFPSISKDLIRHYLDEELEKCGNFIQQIYLNEKDDIFPIIYYSTEDHNDTQISKITRGLINLN